MATSAEHPAVQGSNHLVKQKDCVGQCDCGGPIFEDWDESQYCIDCGYYEQ